MAEVAEGVHKCQECIRLPHHDDVSCSDSLLNKKNERDTGLEISLRRRRRVSVFILIPRPSWGLYPRPFAYIDTATESKKNERDTGLEPVFPAWEADALPDELIPH